MKTEILVEKADIRASALAETKLRAPKDGEALLKIEGFALTTNNVTYAATGDVIGYWKFFPATKAGMGIVPAWGFARVLQSAAQDVKTGDRLYGFLPMASHLTIRPQAKGPSVRDTASHRVELPPVYNTYRRADAFPPRDDALRSIFSPLLITSYLLFDFLKDNDWFGAHQIIIGSASSKTGLGLAHFLAEARPDGPKVIGLTASKNESFVQALGTCDQVIPYGTLETALAKRPSVYVDMAGNAQVRARLHHHLGDDMKHSAAVGTSHWDKFEPTGDLPGARPRFFFAPAQIEKRRADWGPGEIEARLEEAWSRVAHESGRWMSITRSTGLSAASAVYQKLANGAVNPAEGHYIDLP